MPLRVLQWDVGGTGSGGTTSISGDRSTIRGAPCFAVRIRDARGIVNPISREKWKVGFFKTAQGNGRLFSTFVVEHGGVIDQSGTLPLL